VIPLGLLQNTTGDLICLIYAWTTSEALSLLMVVLYIWEQWLDIQRTENLLCIAPTIKITGLSIPEPFSSLVNFNISSSVLGTGLPYPSPLVRADRTAQT
jgi:hypothetical protein